MTTEKRPLVSILILTWNRRNDCIKSIESALVQTYPNIEVVLIDNDSPDGTGDLVSEKYPQVRLIRSYKNLGCPSGRNLGFANCRGKYIYLLDDDGWLAEDAIEKSVMRAETDESLAVVMSCINEMEGDKLVRKRPAGLTEPTYTGSFIGCCSMIRRNVLEQVGYFPDDFFRQGEESDLTLRILDSGRFLFFEPSSVMYHRPSPVGRNPIKFDFYMLRNTMKTGLRLWPFPWVLGRIGLNVFYAFKFALTKGALHLPFVLAGCFIKDLFTLKGKRKPVSPQAMKLYLKLKKQPTATKPSMEK